MVKSSWHNLRDIQNARSVQNIQNITMELLRIIRGTEIDDLNIAMQTIVGTFSEHLANIDNNRSQYLPTFGNNARK